MNPSKTISIDGQVLPFTEGQTIMEAARAGGIYIPHLCYHPDFSPHGSCRLCLVTVNGRFAAACTTPAAGGQEVLNATAQLQDYRRTLLQMLFVEGNHFCPACPKSGSCALQALAYSTGMLTPRFSHFYPRRPLDASHPDVIIDFNRCILCELCVRASRDVDRKHVFAIAGRGLEAHLIVNSPSGKLGDTDFLVTDRAAEVCPVGAILTRNRGFEIPIGERLYDREPIPAAGEVTPGTGPGETESCPN